MEEPGAALNQENVLNKKPVIACDCDEVLGRSIEALAEFHNETYGTSLRLKDFVSYDFSKVWGGSFAQTMEKMNAFFSSPYFDDLEPVEGAFTNLKELQKHCDLVLVTARQNILRSATEEWLEKHFPQLFSKLLFGNQYSTDGKPMYTKGELCKSVNAIALIDDHLANLTEAAPVLKKCILFNHNGHYLWNKELSENRPPNCVELFSWREIRDEIIDLIGRHPTP